MDGHLFQRVVYDFARKVNGKVNDWFPPSYPLNYFCIDIEIGDTVVSILLHEFFPYAAIASYINEFQIQFLDYKNLMLELNPYYTVLGAAFLNEHFNPNIHDLSDSELKIVRHWRPNTNGEIIFNFWN